MKRKMMLVAVSLVLALGLVSQVAATPPNGNFPDLIGEWDIVINLVTCDVNSQDYPCTPSYETRSSYFTVYSQQEALFLGYLTGPEIPALLNFGDYVYGVIFGDVINIQLSNSMIHGRFIQSSKNIEGHLDTTWLPGTNYLYVGTFTMSRRP
jgi:hypothetical protein